LTLPRCAAVKFRLSGLVLTLQWRAQKSRFVIHDDSSQRTRVSRQNGGSRSPLMTANSDLWLRIQVLVCLAAAGRPG